jgi:hypothetical protein
VIVVVVVVVMVVVMVVVAVRGDTQHSCSLLNVCAWPMDWCLRRRAVFSKKALALSPNRRVGNEQCRCSRRDCQEIPFCNEWASGLDNVHCCCKTHMQVIMGSVVTAWDSLRFTRLRTVSF